MRRAAPIWRSRDWLSPRGSMAITCIRGPAPRCLRDRAELERNSPALKAASPVPVIASGDLFTADDAVAVLARDPLRRAHGGPRRLRQSLVAAADSRPTGGTAGAAAHRRRASRDRTRAPGLFSTPTDRRARWPTCASISAGTPRACPCRRFPPGINRTGSVAELSTCWLTFAAAAA